MKLGEAFIEVMPTLSSTATTAVSQEAGRAGRRAGDQFGDSFARAADNKMTVASKRVSAFGTAMATMGAKATIAGASVASATPAVLSLTAALVPAAGAALALPGAMLAIKVASATTKLAVMGVGDAIQEGFTGSAEDAAEALKKLPPEARVFAKSVISLKGDLESLRTVVSNRFFEPINESFEPFVNRYLPLAEEKLPRISQAIGATAGEFAKAATNGKLFQGVNDLLDNTALSIAIANDNVGMMSDAIGDVISVSSNGLPRLASGFSDITARVSDFISKAAETGKLEQWLNGGITTLKTLGSIAGNVGSILWSVLQAANQRGASLLQTLDDITEQIADFLNSAKGIEGLNAAFATMSAIGQGLRTGLGAALPAIAQSIAIAGPSVADLAGVFGQLVIAIAPLLPFITGITVQILKFLMPAIQRVSGFLAEHENIVKAIVIAYAAYLAAVKIQAAIITVQAAGGLVVYLKSLRLVQIATNAWAGIQWVLNAALAANPIGIVIVAVMALIAAIVLAWKNSETFRNIVLTVWGAIKTAIGAVADWFVRNVWPAIKATLDGLGAVFMWLWRNIIQPVWNGIKIAIDVAWAVIKVIFAAIQAYINVLATVFTWFWRNVISPVWTGIKIAIQVAWVAIQIIFKTIEIAVRVLAAVFQWLWQNVIVPVWNAIRSAISAAWNWIRDNVFNPLISFIKGVLVNAWNTAKTLIIAAWNAIKSPVKATWDWIVNTVFNPLKRFITETIPNAFSTGVRAVGSAWDKIKQAAAVPVKFVVETVINNGIIKGFNWIAGKVGVSPISPINLGFASGGILPGYTPGRDVHRFVSPTGGILDLSGGEAILRPELTKALGSDFINMANRAARGGQARTFLKQFIADGGTHQHFANGGIFGGIVGGIKKAWDAFTNPADTFKSMVNGLLGKMPGGGWIQGALRNTVGKLVDGAVSWITSKFNAFGGSINAGSWPSSPAAQRGDSGVWRQIVRLINSTGPLSGAFGNGYRHGDPLWHGSGRAVDWMGFNQDALASFLASKRPLELIHRTNKRDYAYTRGQNYGSFDAGLMEAHRNHIHIAFKLGGILKKLGIFDSGGWLAPGGIGVNLSRKPEAVLTAEESAGLKAMGTDKLVDLLEELITAVREVAPGVGSHIRGSGRGLITKARQA